MTLQLGEIMMPWITKGKMNRVGSQKVKSFGYGMLAVSLALVVTGCGSTTNSSTGSAGQSATSLKPTPGGTIVIAQAAQTNYNWYLPITDASFDYNAGLYDEIYKPLLWINNNYSINWQSSIANKITYNKSGTIYHVFLNPNGSGPMASLSHQKMCCLHGM